VDPDSYQEECWKIGIMDETCQRLEDLAGSVKGTGRPGDGETGRRRDREILKIADFERFAQQNLTSRIERRIAGASN